MYQLVDALTDGCLFCDLEYVGIVLIMCSLLVTLLKPDAAGLEQDTLVK